MGNSATAAATKVCTSCGTRYATDALFCPNDGTPLSSALSSGEHANSDAPDAYLGREISGHIVIRSLAGVGAMGRVYRAHQRGIDRDVAVKILHRELSANQQLVARFHREAKVASRLQHPNVVQVHLAGQLPDGALYIVMEYLDGLSLQSALAAAGGSMPLPRALHVALQICDAVGEAHAQGVVHRDVKPENVMLVRRGDDPDFVKVLDFGIARLNWGEQSMATAAGLIFGTARYISPEGAQGEAVGPQGDVYGIATLLFQMLAGRTPFEGDQAVALLVQQIHDPPPALRSLPRSRDVPEAIADLVMKNLSKNPDVRAADARVLGRSLIEAAKASGLSPDDLVPRSMLLGAKQGAMQLPPVQRTKQLKLGEEANERIAAAEQAKKADPSRTVQQAPPKNDADAGRAALKGPPVAATSKWAPPADFQSKLAPPRAALQSGVDDTLDDEAEPAAPHFPPPTSRVRDAPVERGPYATEFAEPRPHALAPPTPEATPLHARGKTTLESASNADVAPGDGRSAAQPGQHQDDELDEAVPRRARSRAFAVIVLCFVFGALITAIVLVKLNYLGPGSSQETLDETVQRADDAMRHKRWDAPAGDNVRDLTNAGLVKWPNDPRLIDIRSRTTDELVKEAVGRKFAGDVPEALHLAKLANELDPTDTTAQHLVEQYTQDMKLTPPETPNVVPDAGVATTHATGQRAPPGSPPHALLDAQPLKPRLGQPVSFIGKVTASGGGPPRAVEDPHFSVTGPGLAPETKLAAISEGGGVYRTAFTFFEPGKYDVTFNARVEGITLRSGRAIVAGDGATPPSSTEGQVSPPAPSGKWL